MIKINLETGVAIILIFSIMLTIFTVVSFDKTSKEIDKIQKSVDETQALLRDQVIENNKTVKPKSTN